MNEKVILPRFDLPRDSTRVAMRTLWAAGGLVVLATLILGLAMWRHRTLEVATAEQAAAKAAAARRAAMAPPAPPATAAAPREKIAEPGVARAGSGATLAAVASTADSLPEHNVAPSRPHRGGKASSSKARMRALLDQKGTAQRSAIAKGPGKKARSNDDVIDRLLNGG
jgi:hypothetical protein